MFRRVALLRKVLSGRGAGEGQEKLKGGTCAYAGGVCSAATSLNLLCIVEGCLVYTRLHMCLVHLCKASSSGTSHTQTMLFACIYIYIHRKERRREYLEMEKENSRELYNPPKFLVISNSSNVIQRSIVFIRCQ